MPQYVLEDYIEKDKGALCNIICTQPRRLSAIGLADRVSRERGQSVGETVSSHHLPFLMSLIPWIAHSQTFIWGQCTCACVGFLFSCKENKLFVTLDCCLQVGYSVRLESNRSQRTMLLFCTTGILLRRLLSDPDLEGVTHVIIEKFMKDHWTVTFYCSLSGKF